MKGLSDAAFFRVFDALVGAGNPGLRRARWDFSSIHWERERISASRPSYSYVHETFLLSCAERPKWTLMVVKEYWWGAMEGEPLKSARWARPTNGRRADILTWFRGQERIIGSQAASPKRSEEQA
ncbi:MAG: hypothetical protein ACOZAA_07725 [Pseudomonadota bacterium]